MPPGVHDFSARNLPRLVLKSGYGPETVLFLVIEGKKGAPKCDRMFSVFILSNDFELHA